MKSYRPRLSALLLLLTLPVTAHAASITFTSFAPSPATADLSTGTLAFAYYADLSAQNYQADNATPTTDAFNLASFTPFVTTGGNSFPAENPGGYTAISYIGGVGGGNPAIVTGSKAYDQIQFSGGGIYFTITSKLFAPTEIFNFYLVNYSAASDIMASLNDAANTQASVTNQTLSGTDPSGDTAALLTLTVTGNIGDILTFKDTVNTSDPGTGAFGGIAGLQAVTVLAVPEPSTYALFFGGIAMLVMIGRMRRKLGPV